RSPVRPGYRSLRAVRLDHNLDAAIRRLLFDTAIGRHDQLRAPKAEVLNSLRADAHVLPQPRLDRVRAALAQADIVLWIAKRVGVSFDDEGRARVAFDDLAELLQIVDGLLQQVRFVVFKKRAASHAESITGG